MAYFLRSELEAKVPHLLVVQALDDDQDGEEDPGNWDALVAEVGRQIDGRLEGRFAVPLAEPHPAVVREAAVIFAAEAVYLRRGFGGEQNPWLSQANASRARLEKIGRGDLPLTYQAQPEQSSGAVIGEPARMHDASGRMMV